MLTRALRKVVSAIAEIPIRQSSTGAVLTIQEIRDSLEATVGATSAWGEQAVDREKLASSLPTKQEELVPRLMEDSYHEAIIPLSDKSVREKYIGFYDTVRMGRLLENLDTFAVHISYSHNSLMSSGNGYSPLSIVTAMVDEIKIHHRSLDIQSDIVLKGHVSWVGKTSMEIKMWLMQNAKSIVDAMFVMVARNPLNKPAFIHPLQLNSDEERNTFAEGEVHKRQRLEEANYSLLKTAPKENEREVIHNLFLNTLDQQTMSFHSRKLPEGCIWMEDTRLKTAIMCFPEKRNIHNKIFGGFLMRKGFELAFANACIFSKGRPFIAAVDDIYFRCPVSIGSLLLMSSQVSFSEGKEFHIRVHAEVLDPHDGVSSTSNTFNLTFTCDKPVPTVMPKTYGESMLYLDGRRHFTAFQAAKQKQYNY